MNINFKSQTENLNNSTDEYKEIWQKEGEKITSVMNKLFKTPEPLDFDAVIYEGISHSGNSNKPMYLRASYSRDVKVGTLIHELGHRYINFLKNRLENFDEHRTLFLVLYDVWFELYGKTFADMMVSVESQRKGLYDYESAWKDVLNISKEERLSLYKKILSLNK
jgi:hypothetical protein